MRRKSYKTDISDAMWEAIQEYIPQEKPGGRPRDTDIREVVNGILYVLVNDCSWRKMPVDLLPWQTVYDYYRKWREVGVWDEVVAVLEAFGVFPAMRMRHAVQHRSSAHVHATTSTPHYYAQIS